MKEMPDSRAIRDFTESLASIVLIVTCLPTSRRNSRHRHLLGPRPVVDQAAPWRRPRSKSRNRPQLGTDGGPVGVEHRRVEELPLLGLARTGRRSCRSPRRPDAIGT